MARSVIVTGGFGVLGQAVAAAFAAQGDRVARIDFAPAAPAPTEPSTDPAVLALGKELFTTKSTCWTCHAPDGGGMPALGPNLTDEFKLNGHSFADSLKVITDGSPKNPIMIPWKTMLKPEEIYAVASHIWTLKGTTPANPKPAEGVDAAGTAAPPIPAAPAAPAAPATP